MTAVACLRILVGDARNSAQSDQLAVMVAKIAGAFLESRWRWPRRHGEIAPFAFLLADPKASELDAAELTALSEDLHLKLFGMNGAGSICLGMLEGEQEAVTRFAAVDAQVLRRVLSEGGDIPGLVGRISEITPQGVRVVSPAHEAGPLRSVAAEGSTAPRSGLPADRDFELGYRGVWCSLKDQFIGDGLVARQVGARAFHSIVDGPGELPTPDATAAFDITGLEAAPEALAVSRGTLFLPISFSTTIHPHTRESYRDALERLPQKQRPRLAAAVYGVPRAPSFAAIAQLKAFLAPYFSFIDLQTADPDFQIDSLTLEAVNSVTLTLPDADDGVRIAIATRFMANREAFQRRRIWPAITNVRTRRELEFCIRQRVPFLSGKAVCTHLSSPANHSSFTVDHLPRRTTTLPNAHGMSVAI